MASNRIKVTGVLNKVFSFERPEYAGFGRMETVHIYKFTGEDGKIYVWKTTGVLSMTVYTEEETVIDGWGRTWVDGRGKHYYHVYIPQGSKIIFSASVKGETEYKGEPQTEISRVKVEEIIFRAESEEEKAARREAEKEAKKRAQLESITENDLVWTMPYRQYKEHYSDCETIIDSFTKFETAYGRQYAPTTIKVIIREGRLKKSGVRGKHFSEYWIEWTENGDYTRCESFRAVCVENAIEQAKKRYPNGTYFHFDRIRTF